MKKNKPEKEKTTKKKTAKKKTVEVNTSLLNAIAPLSINVERNFCGYGENYCKAYVITRYNDSPDLGWLSAFTGIPNTFFNINFRPAEIGALLQNINKNVSKDRARMYSVKDELELSRIEKRIEDSMFIIRELDQKNSSMGQYSICITATGKTFDEMTETAREIETTAAVAGCKVTPLSWGQREAMEAILPSYRINDYVHQAGSKIMPMKTIQGGFPQATNSFKDPDGFVLGVDNVKRKHYMLDPWVRGGDRTNSNFVFLGKPGQGKSTALKWVMANLHATGTKLICIDPESEYKEMCQYFKGDWLDCGGDSRSRINPLQIFVSPDESDDRQCSLSAHLKKLETFFRLYINGLSDYEMAALKEVIIDLYKTWGIGFDTDVSHLSNKDYPVFSDLYDLLLKYKEKNRGKENHYENLSLLFKDIATGSDATLWNGITTLTANSSFIVLDTSKLGDSADNIRRAQYFNVLSWTWEQMSKDRTEKVFLVCDEAYLMIDPRVPQSLVFLRDVSKRARKYEAGLAIISHSISDFLDPQIKMYGQPLMDNPTYKFMFGTDGQNLKEIAYLYNLNETEKKTLEKQQQGTALFSVGGKKFVIDVKIPQWFFSMMGNAGGRGAEPVSRV